MNEDDKSVIIIACGFLIAFSLVSLILGSINAILRLTNPAYYALNFFIHLGQQVAR